MCKIDASNSGSNWSPRRGFWTGGHLHSKLSTFESWNSDISTECRLFPLKPKPGLFIGEKSFSRDNVELYFFIGDGLDRVLNLHSEDTICVEVGRRNF